MSYASHSNRNFQIMQSNGLPCGVPLFSCDEHLKNWCCHSVCLSIHPFFLSIFGAFGIKDGFNGNQWMFQGRLKSVPRVFSGCSNKFFGRFFFKVTNTTNIDFQDLFLYHPGYKPFWHRHRDNKCNLPSQTKSLITIYFLAKHLFSIWHQYQTGVKNLRQFFFWNFFGQWPVWPT